MRLKRTLKRQANRSSPSYLSPVSPEEGTEKVKSTFRLKVNDG